MDKKEHDKTKVFCEYCEYCKFYDIKGRCNKLNIAVRWDNYCARYIGNTKSTL